MPTVKEVIEILSKQPQDSKLYFDCPHCNRANEFAIVEQATVVRTTDTIIEGAP